MIHKLMTTTRVNYSGKLALIAALIFGLAISSQVSAKPLSPEGKAAVEQHFERLAQQQEMSEEQLISGIETTLDAQIAQVEQRFMKETCAKHQRHYDRQSQSCYE